MKRIAQYLTRERVIFLSKTTKKDALNELVDCLSESPAVTDSEKFRAAIFERESTLSTGIGLGIAVPHAKIASIEDFVLGVGISRDGIPYEALDDKPVHIIVMIAGPQGRQSEYLKILARTTLLLKSSRNREAILEAQTTEDVYQLFTNEFRSE